MSKQTTFRDLLHSQENAKEVPNSASLPNEKLHTFEQIEGTPLFVIGDDELGYAGVIGRNVITDRMPTKDDVITYVQEKPYELLIALMSAVIDLQAKMRAGKQAENAAG